MKKTLFSNYFFETCSNSFKSGTMSFGYFISFSLTNSKNNPTYSQEFTPISLTFFLLKH